jgi:hypothetical protein
MRRIGVEEILPAQVVEGSADRVAVGAGSPGEAVVAEAEQDVAVDLCHFRAGRRLQAVAADLADLGLAEDVRPVHAGQVLGRVDVVDPLVDSVPGVEFAFGAGVAVEKTD